MGDENNMDGSIANGVGAAIISMIIIVILIVSGIWLGIGYFVGNGKYDKGYLQGQLDCQKGVNKVYIKRDSTYQLK